jgi:hypothetical protein
MRRRRLASTLFASVLALGFTSVGHAQSFSCSVTDTVGDPVLSPGRGFDGASYQDIVETAIESNGAEVFFTMEVAAPIPDAPAVKTPNGRLLWMWGVNTAPGVPKGFPLGRGLAGLLDFWIHVSWDGAEWAAIVIDRRPAAIHGGEPVVTAVPFQVNGTLVRITAPASLFDFPLTFSWGSSTWIWSAPLGTTAAHVVDRAPNGPAASCAP